MNSRQSYRSIGLAVATILFWAVVPMGINAQPATDTTGVIQIDVREFPLVDAIQQLIDQTGLDVAYDPRLLYWKTSNCAISAPNIETALDCILAGTGLTYRKLASGSSCPEGSLPSSASFSFSISVRRSFSAWAWAFQSEST